MAASSGTTSPTATSSARRSAPSPSRLRPQRHLCRHGRGDHPRQRLARRRRLQVHRRRQDAGSTSASRRHATSARCASIPQNPDIVYVAALGHAHGPNKRARRLPLARRRQDVGAGPLRQAEKVGAIDLSMDPNNPRVLYASLLGGDAPPALSLSSGGEGCGLFKITDGGDTWTDITRNDGPAQGSASARSASPSRPPATTASGPSSRPRTARVFRSDDGGETLAAPQRGAQPARSAPGTTRTSSPTRQDADTVWVLNVQLLALHRRRQDLRRSARRRTATTTTSGSIPRPRGA